MKLHLNKEGDRWAKCQWADCHYQKDVSLPLRTESRFSLSVGDRFYQFQVIELHLVY